ncbi:MAG: class I mannose-6-phosphate isomerase, partial [Planctomycetota bacterium]|nr:class I mannose-6-phosphate isomerase [Planctomycetota bacterium]
MELLSQPLFFLPNRVWRCYAGGFLLERFLGYPQPRDGHLPEEWLASTTKAENGARAQGPEEGLSRLKMADGSPGPLLRDCLPEGVGFLCKFLDAAVRLPIQCHPDRAFARTHYRSPYGKTECWLILDTRTIKGVEPYLLMGFKPGISAERFCAAVEKQDSSTLENMLHRVPVKPGDCYLIPGRF